MRAMVWGMTMSGQMIGWFFVALSLSGALRMVFAPSFRDFAISFLFCIAGAAVLAGLSGLFWLALFLVLIHGAMVFVMALAGDPGGSHMEKGTGAGWLAIPPALLLLAWLFWVLASGNVVPMHAAGALPGMGEAARVLCGEMLFLLPSALLLLMAASVAALAPGSGGQAMRLRQDWRWQMRQDARTIILHENGEGVSP